MAVETSTFWEGVSVGNPQKGFLQKGSKRFLVIFFDWILKKSRDPQAVIAFNALRHALETPSLRVPLHAAPQASMPHQPPAEQEVNPGSP